MSILATYKRGPSYLFDSMLSPFIMPSYSTIPVDVSESDENIVVSAELAGIHKKDVRIEFNNSVLTINAKKEERAAQYSEITTGLIERHIKINTEIDPDTISASYDNGLLKVTLPKSQSNSRLIEIQ